MSLLKLLTEKQLPLSKELEPKNVKKLLQDYLDSAEFGTKVYKEDISTFDDVKKLWGKIREDILKELVEQGLHDYTNTIEYIGYIHESVNQFIYEQKEEFIYQIKELGTVDQTLDVLLEIFDIPDHPDFEETLSEDEKIESIIDIILNEPVPQYHRERRDLDKFYIEDLEVQNWETYVHGETMDVVQAGVYYFLEDHMKLNPGREGGIDDMFYAMEDNIETINGIDHVYAERELAFNTPEKVLSMHKQLGIYWSWFEGGGRAYSGSGDNKLTLYGMIPVSSVDWRQTFFVNMYDLAHELEVTVLQGEPILLRKVKFQFTGNDINEKIDSIIAMYFPHKNKTFNYSFRNKVKKFLMQSNDTLLRGSEITMNFKDEKYYSA